MADEEGGRNVLDRVGNLQPAKGRERGDFLFLVVEGEVEKKKKKVSRWIN